MPVLRSVLALLLVPLLLGGCIWVGPPLYDASRAETPLAPGRYRLTVDGDPNETRVTVTGTTTFVTDAGRPMGVLLIPLAMKGRQVWIIQAGPGGTGDDENAYGVLERTTGGWVFEPLIECGATKDIVRAAGGVIKPSKQPGPNGSTVEGPSACVFHNAASLETAMRAALARGVPRQTLTRLGG